MFCYVLQHCACASITETSVQIGYADVLKKCITYRTGFTLLSQHVNPCYLFQDKAAFIALQIHSEQPQLQLLHVWQNNIKRIRCDNVSLYEAPVLYS